MKQNSRRQQRHGGRKTIISIRTKQEQTQTFDNPYFYATLKSLFNQAISIALGDMKEKKIKNEKRSQVNQK
jgi:hypothetical protein